LYDKVDAKVYLVSIWTEHLVNEGEHASYLVLLYKHQWYTRWAFARKHNIFSRKNNTLSSHVKRSPLLWLHNKSCVSQRKWDTKFLFSCWKIFHSFTALSREIFFKTKRNFVSLRGHVISSISSLFFFSRKKRVKFISRRVGIIHLTLVYISCVSMIVNTV